MGGRGGGCRLDSGVKMLETEFFGFLGLIFFFARFGGGGGGGSPGSTTNIKNSTNQLPFIEGCT